MPCAPYSVPACWVLVLGGGGLMISLPTCRVQTCTPYLVLHCCSCLYVDWYRRPVERGLSSQSSHVSGAPLSTQCGYIGDETSSDRKKQKQELAWWKKGGVLDHDAMNKGQDRKRACCASLRGEKGASSWTRLLCLARGPQDKTDSRQTTDL